MQFWPLFDLPLLDLCFDQYLLSRNRKPANFPYNLALFHSDSTNIGLIANLKAAGERAAKTAQAMYWSCHDTIRTQKLNCSQSCKMEPQSGSNLAKNRRFYVRSGLQPGASYPVRFLGGSWPGPQPGNPEPLLTLASGHVPKTVRQPRQW